jgi:hypothetical protein
MVRLAPEGFWMRRFLGTALAAALTAALAMGPAAASAAVSGPRVSGSITGTAKRGDLLTFRVVAVERGGFGHIDTVRVALLLHSVILDEITYDRTHDAVATTSSLPVPAGTRAVVTGSFLSVDGRSVEIRSSGDRVALTMRARVLQDVPSGAAFSLGASDDGNQVSWATRPVTVPQASAGGFSWGTLALAIVVALFAGGFVGNLFAGRRPAQPKLSVYDAIRRRIERDRARRPA